MTDQTVAVNPLLAKVRIPGTTFRLPSLGLFYTNGELSEDVKNGEVEVFPMTAIDEIILATPDKVLSGKGILEVFSRCVPQVAKPGQLLARDVDFLMVCLRMATFGPQYDVTWKHDCENAKTHDYAIDLQQMTSRARPIDPTSLKMDYVITLENGQRVTMKPFTQDSVTELLQASAFKATNEMTEQQAEEIVINTLVAAIQDVDGETRRDFIAEWAKAISLKWKRQLEVALQTTSHWGVDFETKHKCKDCGAEVALTISPNPMNFFM